MNDLIPTILAGFPCADLSCRECGCSNIKAEERSSTVSASNPLGERMAVIYCGEWGLTDEAIRPHDVRETVKAWLVEETITYWVSYHFDGDNWYLDIPSIGDIKDGFWINKDRKYTQASDAVKWIPPSQIQFVDKVTKEMRLSEK